MKNQSITTLLLASMLSASLFSCGGETTTEPENTSANADTAAPVTEAVTVDPDYVPDSLGDLDLGGETVSILTTTWYNASGYIYAAEENGEVVNDALYAARTAAEERLNASVTLTVDKDFGETAILFHNAVMAGDTVYDILYNHDLQTIRSTLNGDFLNMRDVKTFDFSKPWWTQTTEEFTVSGKLYCTSSYLSIAGIYMNYILAVNKDLAASYDLAIAGIIANK